MIDNTVNRAGPGNMMPHHPLRADAVTALVDEFVRAKWLPSERRMEEIAILYKGERDAARCEVAALWQIRAENERLRGALIAIYKGDDSPDGMQGDIALTALKGCYND